MIDNPAVTLAVGCIFGAIVLIVSPAHALTVYLASLIWYPSSYTVPMGTLDWSVRRIVIVVLLARVFISTDLVRTFKFTRLDKLVILLFACETVAGLITTQDIRGFIEYQGGQVFDMVLPYTAVRLILVKKEHYLSLLRGVLLISAPFAVLAFYQFWTGGNPFSFVREYIPKVRNNRFRAELTFDVSIMMGLYFASMGAACVGVLGFIKSNKWIAVVAAMLMGVGAASSNSSGPILACILVAAFLCFYRWRHEWRLALTIAVMGCGIVEIVSNRHFYDVLGGFTLDPMTAWYRSRLIAVAFWEGGMSGHWLVGFGNVDPGWGPAVDGRGHTDLVNHFILLLASYGLVGLLPFLWMNWEAAKSLLVAIRRAATEPDRWMIWSLASGLFGITGAFVSVSLFGPPTTTYYMLVAVAASMPAYIAEESRQPRLVMTPRRTRSPELMLVQ
jgi:hypothetical protein